MLFTLLFPLGIYTANIIDKVRNSLLGSGYVASEQYVAVIDAGSTGTRINMYGFLVPGNIISYYSIVKSTPGLHQITNKSKVRKYLRSLLEEGREVLSKRGIDIRSIPFVLQGTAGLRSLEPSKREELFEYINHIFTKYGIKIYEINVISGYAEGAYALESLKLLIQYNNNVIYKYGCDNNELKKYLKAISSDFCDFKVSSTKYHGIIDMGGGSVQIAYEFSTKDPYDDPIHVIHSYTSNIYINFFPGWGLNEGIKVLKKNKKYTLTDSEGHEITMFDKLLDDFKFNDKPDINNVDELYLMSYYYDRLSELGCDTKTDLGEIKYLFDKVCGDKPISFDESNLLDSFAEETQEDSKFCDEVYYLYKFLEAQGLEHAKPLFIVSDIDGINLNWSLSKGIMML